MSDHQFYRFGKLVYHLRWYLLCVWIVVLCLCVPVIPQVATVFKSTGFTVDNSPSVKADETLSKQFGYGSNKFMVIYQSETLSMNSPAFMDKIKKSLADLKKLPYKYQIIYPDTNAKQVSKDKRTAYAVILIKQEKNLTPAELAQLQSLVKTPSNMKMVMGGEPLFVESVNKQTQHDLYAADFIAAPVTIIMMLLIFESIAAAMVPVLTGAGCAVMILSLLCLIGSQMTLSIFTLNIALLLGLCLSLDYALFIISRFRFELRNGHSVQVALAITQATAGKAVFFSGLAVLVSLSALLLFPINILFSVGVGGICAVFVAVVTANFVLPSILALMGERINWLPISALTTLENGRSPFWHWLVTKVVKHPYAYFVVVLSLLLMMSYPMTHAVFGISDHRILPGHSEGREFFDTYNSKFSQSSLTPIQLTLISKDDILLQKNLKRMRDISENLKQHPSVDYVTSIVTTKPMLSAEQYHQFYTMPKKNMNNDVKTLLATTTGDRMSVMTIVSKYPVNSDESHELVKDIQDIKLKKGMTAEVAGVTLRNAEVFTAIKSLYPSAIMMIMGFTYLILLVLLRSLFLPIKAIITTILSLCASYGVLVFIIQEGHLSHILNFEPQAMLDVSLLVIIFCALFGFSMDYEVFLLTRIKEHYDKTKNNIESIVYGVEHSSRIITSAAFIVIAICCSFMVADVLMVKAFGLGIAVAIFTDAFLIRSLLVPAVMAILGKINWYLPKWLDRILPRL